MEYKTIVTGMLGENCHLIYKNGNCVVVDPGDNAEKISETIEKLNLVPLAIFLTHTHFDHIGASYELSEKFNIPVYVSEKDFCKVTHEVESVYYLKGDIKPELVKFVTDGEKIILGDLEFSVLETPGHSEGSVCFIGDKLLAAGDLLFRESVGRCDLEGGSSEKMKDTFVNKVMNLNKELIVLTGHGESTTIGYEIKYNPYISYYNIL